MRKQYNFWPGDEGLDAWDVDRLVELSRDLPVIEVPLSEIWEIDTTYWGTGNDFAPTVRWVAEHTRLVTEVDPQYPIILSADGRVMDGMHRVVRALVEGRQSISAVRFDATPEPDYYDCSPDELPY